MHRRKMDPAESDLRQTEQYGAKHMAAKNEMPLEEHHG